MQIALPELNAPALLVLDPESRLTDEEYFAFCAANRDLHIERTAQGEIVIVPPAGMESDYRNADITSQLVAWAKRTRRGKALGSSAEFFLPDGSALSPDAAWISNERLALVPRPQLRQFPKIAPGVCSRGPVAVRQTQSRATENAALDRERRRTRMADRW